MIQLILNSIINDKQLQFKKPTVRKQIYADFSKPLHKTIIRVHVHEYENHFIYAGGLTRSLRLCSCLFECMVR